MTVQDEERASPQRTLRGTLRNLASLGLLWGRRVGGFVF